MAALQQQLDKLRVHCSEVRQYAVAGVFDAVKAPAVAAHVRAGAVRQCLELPDQRALEVAVSRLQDLVSSGSWTAQDALDALLAALAVADARAASPLARGLLGIWSSQLGVAGTAGGDWRAHPLARALQANPAATQPLLQGVLSYLARAAGAAGAPGTVGFSAALAAAKPFLVFVLLSPELAAQRPALGGELHGSLARFACCVPSQQAQQEVLGLLVQLFPAHQGRLPDQQGALIAAIGDIMDVVESCSEEPEEGLMSALAATLVSHCYELAGRGGILQPALAALHRLAEYWPALLGRHVGDLAQLISLTGGLDCAGLLSLLVRQLEQQQAEAAQGLHPAVAAFVAPPLLQLLAYQQDPAVKQWASHCLALLSSAKTSSGSSLGVDAAATGGGSSAANVGRDGGASLTAEALTSLAAMWQDDRLALDWLISLGTSLSEAAAAAASSGGGGFQQAAREQRQLSGRVAGMLCALLAHPERRVQLAAVSTLDAAVQAVPLLGVPLLPVLVHRAQQLVESFLGGRVQEPPASLLPLLQALPGLGQHAAVVPFVVRSIQPLLSLGAPEVLQAVALRMLCLLWQRGGRGYQHLRTAILGYTAPGKPAGLELRVARAECVRDICEEDPTKGVELIKVVQECLEDDAPQVQALGLRCIELLCEADSLDFYAAWRVVQRRYPSLPAHPRVAAAWVGLMSQGVLDADVYPEVAKAILSALWLATEHPARQVRRQAYLSLAEYSLGLQEQLEALPPLIDFVELLARERAAPNCAACEGLVAAALAYEYATRRRPGSGPSGDVGERRARARPSRLAAAAAGAAGTAASAAAHRLLSTLPKQLLGGSTSSAAGVLQRVPELSAVAVLSLYAPPAPTATTAAGTAAAAKGAAATYQLLFSELLKQPICAQLGASGRAAACLPAWQRFLRRWGAALRAAAGPQQQAQAATESTRGSAARTAALLELWAAIQPQLGSASPLVAENAVWAAAALCSLGQQPAKEVVHDVHAELDGLEGSAAAPAAAQRAALAALGALAGHARAVLGLPAVESSVDKLVSACLSSPSPAARAAAAEGLGLACQQLYSGLNAAGAALEGAPRAILLRALGGLLSLLCALCQPAGAARLADAAAAVGVQLQEVALDDRASEDGELLQTVCSGLSRAVPAAAQLGQPALLEALHSTLLAEMAGSAQQQAASCALLGAVTAEGFWRSWLSAAQAGNSLAVMQGLVRSGPAVAAAVVDGRTVGAAAAALGSLLPALVAQGYAPEAAWAPEATLQTLAELAESAAAALPHAAAAKQGIAAGIAGLLAPEAGIDLRSAAFKAGLKALEGLALQDPDPRVRRGSGSALAELCCQFRARREAAGPGAAGGSSCSGAAAGQPSGGVAAAKSLAALPEEGAMRPLVESLLEGRWASAVLDEGAEAAAAEELGSAAAASILRCLASAERLPALSFGALCRRLLRSHPGSAEVEEGCIELAAAHGQVQANQLGDLVVELLEPARFQQLSASTQLAALHALPGLLAALPDSQAVSTLRALCALCPDLSSAGAGGADSAAASWVEALLQGLHGIAAGGPTAAEAQSSSPALQLALQQQLVVTVLPRLPPPSLLPVALAGSAVAAGAAGVEEGAGASGPQCWEAAIACFAALPATKLEALLLSPDLFTSLPIPAAYLASALVARGTLGQQALQAPRNLLLNGTLARDPGAEGAVAAFVGRAAAAALAPAAAQQWLADVLAGAKACANPPGALKLACCLLASAAAASSVGGGGGEPSELGLGHITAVSCEASVATLDHSMAQLAETPTWRSSIIGLLSKLTDATAAAAVAPGGCQGAVWREGLVAAQLGARQLLPQELWGLLAGRLAGWAD